MKDVSEITVINVKGQPHYNNTVSRRIDEMGQDVENQLIMTLRSKKISIQMDESTNRNGEAVLILYVRYMDKDEFVEEFLFCLKLEGSTTARDIFTKLKNYMDINKIPMENVTSCAADGAPNMMGKRNAECGFSAVNDILNKKRNRLDITQHGDLRLKLTKIEPDIASLGVNHQAQNSH
ncbi:hypothetical protein ACJJTC_011006 [Scirpophaga incertulas]